MRAALLIASVVCLSGCQAVIGEPPGAEQEQPFPDAAPEPEQSDPDAAAPPPSGTADAAPAPDGPTAAERCAALYGGAPDFEYCSTTGDTCTFIAANGDVTCNDHCAAGGGLCLGAQDNDVGSCTDLESDPTADCTTTDKIDLLCTCTLPPP